MKYKCLPIGIILLFVGTAVIPTSGQNLEKASLPMSRGNIIYVGGSGPGNYTRIQDAINDSSPGDSIYVYNGTYNETIHVNVERLKIIGENRNNTIIGFINANYTDKTIIIQTNYSIISGFTIIAKNYCIYIGEGLTNTIISNNNFFTHYRGVELRNNEYTYCNVIENNIFYSISCGIVIIAKMRCDFNIINNNTFIDNARGITINGHYNNISNNIFLNCSSSCIDLNCGESTVENNIFIGNDLGIDILSTSKNKIIGNHFENNICGIDLSSAQNTLVTQNNFINNKKHAKFYEENRKHGNNWDNNYWTNPFYFFGKVFIFGRLNTGIPRPIQIDPENIIYFNIPWINFDNYPAQEPYNISRMS